MCRSYYIPIETADSRLALTLSYDTQFMTVYTVRDDSIGSIRLGSPKICLAVQ